MSNVYNNFIQVYTAFYTVIGALSGTRTHATGFGDLYSIQLSYERAMHIITKKTVR